MQLLFSLYYSGLAISHLLMHVMHDKDCEERFCMVFNAVLNHK